MSPRSIIIEIASLTTIIDDAIALRNTKLPKLISGELRVKDAEKFLAERGL